MFLDRCPEINFLQVITGAIPSNVGEKLIGLVTSRDEIADLLKVSVTHYENNDFTNMPNKPKLITHPTA
jgi:hypothetical protein